MGRCAHPVRSLHLNTPVPLRESLSDACPHARWPEDAEFAEGETFVWSVLKPCDWNQEVPMGWRYSAAELQRSREAQKQ